MSIYEFFSAPVDTQGNALLNWENLGPREILTYAWVYRRAGMHHVTYWERQPPLAVDNAVLMTSIRNAYNTR